MEITRRKFELADADALRETIDIGANLVDWAVSMSRCPDQETFTWLADGRIAAAGGIVRLWPGVGEAWSVFAQWAERYKRLMLIHTRRFLDEKMAAYQLHRVQATLRTDLPDSWLIHLGFEKEGMMRMYCADGCDSAIWSRINQREAN